MRKNDDKQTLEEARFMLEYKREFSRILAEELVDQIRKLNERMEKIEAIVSHTQPHSGS